MVNGFKRDDRKTKECIENSPRDNTVPSIANSTRWACEGVVSTKQWQGSIYDCLVVFEANQLWLLEGGGFTFKWNDERPRPVPLDEGVLEKEPRGNRSDDIDPSFSSTEGEETSE